MKRLLLIAFSILMMSSARAESPQIPEGQPGDSVARVGDQTITYSQLNTQLNSSAVIGLSVPTLGSAERRRVMLALLDKAISANLLYLDAIKQGTDKDPVYSKEMSSFSDAILGELYRRKYLVGEIQVTPDEVDAFIRESFAADTEVTDRLRLSVEATIRNRRFAERTQTSRERLREGSQVVVHTEKLDFADDPLRAGEEVLAEVGDRQITWDDAKDRLTTLNTSVDMEHRIESLDGLIDQLLMAQKGREAGLEKDSSYQKRLAEFRKTRLLNLHREKLVQSMEPSEEDLHDYYRAGKDRIATKERRRIQMVVLPTEEQAEVIKGRIEAGEITIYEAALEHSIDPNVKRNLGDFGWVTKGSGFPKLDELTFFLHLDQLGGPVQSPAGWHLVRVIDQRDAAYTDFDDADTGKVTRRMFIKQRMDDYLVGLRQHGFPVVVYEDNLNRLFREEAQWIAAKTKEMESHPERAQQILDELRAIVE